jgi:23S rRNA (cytosine1962-C5)-methyltransferase
VPTEPTLTTPVAGKVFVQAGRADMFAKRHPWVFSGAVRNLAGQVSDGQVVDLCAGDQTFLARGYWNSKSQIRVHVLTWEQEEQIDEAFWRKRLSRAIASRALEPRPASDNAGRLVNAENDFLPGLIVDRYGDWLVLQALTLGIDRLKQPLAQLLLELMPTMRGVYERSDVEVRAKEGLPKQVGVLAGEAPPPLVEISEQGQRFLVDVYTGHKTGFYLDQRVSRARFAAWLAAAAPQGDILNCFAYTGGFSLYACAAGLNTVINVDSSAESLALARQNHARNGQQLDDSAFVEGNVFQVLRAYRAADRRFAAIVLDPPKFAQNRGQIERACNGYKDINLLAFQLLAPGGLLFTFSCSGLIDTDLFQKVVFGALADSKREAQILERLTAAPDHPISLAFPEGGYLKGLACRVW